MAGALVTAESAHDVAETVDLISSELRDRGVRLFAVIDHAAGAREAGLELADEVVLVFGNPAVGTALMQADPRTGLDLPVRLLVWSDGGTTRLAFRDPHALTGDFAVADRSDVLDALRGLLDHLVTTVAPQPAPEAAVDPVDLLDRVRADFVRHALLDHATITVQVHGHDVTLTGTVGDRAERDEAERVARAAPGVGSVHNRLRTLPHDPHGRPRR